MRKMLSLIAGLICPLLLHAQAVPRDTTLSISATRTVRIMADRASIFVAVEGSAETPAGAVTRLDQKVKVILDSLTHLGRRVQADRPIGFGVLLAPNNGYPASTTPSYLARAAIRVLVSRLDGLSAVQAAMISGGAINTGGQSYESSATDSTFRAKVAEALASARQTAESMALAQGFRLGPMIDMSTNGPNQFQQSGQISFDPRTQSSISTAPDIVVSANVSIRFRLLPK